MLSHSKIIDKLFEHYYRNHRDYVLAYLENNKITELDLDNITDIANHPRFKTIRTETTCVLGLDMLIFGYKSPEVENAVFIETTAADETRTESIIRQRYFRYPDFPRKPDPRFPKYNINQVPTENNCIYIAEGPTADSLDYFKETIMAIGYCTILALGATFESGVAKYYPYTLYQVVAGTTNLRAGNFKMDGLAPIKCVQVPGWSDHSAFEFTDEEAERLFKWFNDTTKPKIIHCSAGLGRSGAVVLAYLLAKHHGMALATKSEDEIIKIMINELAALRTARPGTVLKVEQFMMAYTLGMQFSAIQETLEAKGRQEINTSFDLSETQPLRDCLRNSTFDFFVEVGVINVDDLTSTDCTYSSSSAATITSPPLPDEQSANLSETPLLDDQSVSLSETSSLEKRC